MENTCRISSRPRTAVLTSSTGDSSVGSLSENSGVSEHTREQLATCKFNKPCGHVCSLLNDENERLNLRLHTRSMMSSRLVKWCVLHPSARSTSSCVACFLTARSRSSAIPLSSGITTISINSSWKKSKRYTVLKETSKT